MIITNLEKKIGDLSIQIPNLYIEHGKIHGLLGGNGCGKSTLAKLLIGAIPLDAGELSWEGIDMQEVTLASQRPYLLQRTVYENLIYPLQIRKINIVEDEMNAWLLKAGLLHKKDQYARSLSSGEQQKLSFLRALIFKPKFIILDETLSNLDPDSLHVFMSWIKEYQKENNTTWLIISHQMTQIRALCDIVHMMDRGHVVKTVPIENLQESMKQEEMKAYLEYQML